jgi:hypothetical protein
MTKGKRREPAALHLMNRDPFVAAYSLPQEEVPLPDGGTLLIRAFDAEEFIEYNKYFNRDKDGKPQWSDLEKLKFGKFMTHLCAINPDGTKMFPDFSAMPGLRPDVISMIGSAALRLNDLITENGEVIVEDPNVSDPSSTGSQTVEENSSTKSKECPPES